MKMLVQRIEFDYVFFGICNTCFKTREMLTFYSERRINTLCYARQ